MRWECRERFPRHILQGKPLVSDPGMHHGTCVTHVPWCISGSPTRGGGENVPGVPGACATRNFTYLARGSLTCFLYCWIFVRKVTGTVYLPGYETPWRSYDATLVNILTIAHSEREAVNCTSVCCFATLHIFSSVASMNSLCHWVFRDSTIESKIQVNLQMWGFYQMNVF